LFFHFFGLSLISRSAQPGNSQGESGTILIMSSHLLISVAKGLPETPLICQ